MKGAAQCARNLRRLIATLTRRYGKPKIDAVGDPADEFIRAALARFAPESRLGGAISRLRSATVDLNDLRVTPAVDAAVLLGRDFPRANDAAEAMLAALNALFNKRHTLDLPTLVAAGRREAERLIRSLPGIHPHDSALFLLRTLKVHAMPVEPRSARLLAMEGCVDPASSHVAIQEFVGKIVPAAHYEATYILLKRHAATVTLPEPPPAPPRAAEPRPMPAEPVGAGAGPASAPRPTPAATQTAKHAPAAGSARSAGPQKPASTPNGARSSDKDRAARSVTPGPGATKAKPSAPAQPVTPKKSAKGAVPVSRERPERSTPQRATRGKAKSAAKSATSKRSAKATRRTSARGSRGSVRPARLRKTRPTKARAKSSKR